MHAARLLPIAASLLTLSLMSCSAPSKSGCESDTQCREGRICLDGSCESPGGQNMTPNNTTSNNTTSNNMSTNNITPPPPNITPNNVSPNNEDPDVALCARFCDRLLGSCVDQQCDIGPDVRGALDELIEYCMYIGFNEGEPGCVEALTDQPALRDELEEVIASFACDGPELTAFRCDELDLDAACGCDPALFPDIGNRCDSDDACDGAGLPGACLDESNEPGFPDGYCVSLGCPLPADDPRPRFEPLCGEGNVCARAGGPGEPGICVDGCDAHADCRNEYQCRLVGVQDRAAVRVCLPECGPNLACQNPDERCSQGRCELRCQDTGMPSSRQICEGLGFECQPDDAGSFWCVMP